MASIKYDNKILFLCNCSANKELLLKLLRDCRQHTCEFCKINFKSNVELEEHDVGFHRSRLCAFYGPVSLVADHRKHCSFQEGTGLTNHESDPEISFHPFTQVDAFKGYVKTFKFNCKSAPYHSLLPFFTTLKPIIKKIIIHSINELSFIKCQINLFVVFRRIKNETREEWDAVMNSKQRIILNKNYFNKFFNQCVASLENQVTIFEVEGSGWILDRIERIDIRVGIYRPFVGACYIPCPTYLSMKKSIINLDD